MTLQLAPEVVAEARRQLLTGLPRGEYHLHLYATSDRRGTTWAVVEVGRHHYLCGTDRCYVLRRKEA